MKIIPESDSKVARLFERCIELDGRDIDLSWPNRWGVLQSCWKLVYGQNWSRDSYSLAIFTGLKNSQR